MTTQTAVASILESYDKETLRDIAEHGCVSGVATDHITYSETSDFYDKYEDEINSYAEDCFGDEFLAIFAKDDITSLKNNIVWFFVESIASDYAYREDEMYGEVA